MMCYRDRTYCDAPCATAGCDRLVTPEVEADARRVDLWVARADFRDTCTKYQPRRDAAALSGGDEGKGP